jgi:hypothetical protein
MTTKKKAARVGTSTASDTAFGNRNPTPIHYSIKAVIVRLAVWGVIPASFATWLIQRGGLKDA